MAGRTLNRRELRKHADQADAAAAETAVDAPVAKKGKAKKAAVVRPKKPRAKKAPARMCARWCVFDGAMKQVAVFDYNQRAAADEKLAAMLARGKGVYFLQIVKEIMPEAIIPEAAAPEAALA